MPTDTIVAVPIAKRPLHTVLWHMSIGCFLGTLLTDVTYWRSAEMMWSNFSAWLLTAGLVLGGLALLVALFDLVTGRLVGVHRMTPVSLLGGLVVLALSFWNALVHARDAWASVYPTGLILSAAVAVVIVVSGLMGRTAAHRGYVGVVR